MNIRPVTIASVLAMLSAALGTPASSQDAVPSQFKVGADPMNLPFSNKGLEGFENRIAELIAGEFGLSPTYVWWGQRRGFIRNTMKATLQEARCDVVMGVPKGYDLVAWTKPYYRSTYVFVYPKESEMSLKSLDDPILRTLKIGVHLLGNDYMNPPPVHELGKRGIVENVVGFDTFYSESNSPGKIIDAVANGEIDVAIVWGPVAGYFSKLQSVPLELVPVPSGERDLPFAFDICLGVRHGEKELKARLRRSWTEKVRKSARFSKNTESLPCHSIELRQESVG